MLARGNALNHGKEVGVVLASFATGIGFGVDVLVLEDTAGVRLANSRCLQTCLQLGVGSHLILVRSLANGARSVEVYGVSRRPLGIQHKEILAGRVDAFVASFQKVGLDVSLVHAIGLDVELTLCVVQQPKHHIFFNSVKVLNALFKEVKLSVCALHIRRQREGSLLFQSDSGNAHFNVGV